MMAVTSLMFLVFFSASVLHTTEACTDWTDCPGSQLCCSDNVCRENCQYCSLDSDCSWTEQCCDNTCIDGSDTCRITGGAVAGIVVGLAILCGIVISIIACCCCACCPYYRYRSPGVVLVQGQQPYSQFGVTTTTTSSMVAPPMQPQGQVYQPQPPQYFAAGQQPGPYPAYPANPGKVWSKSSPACRRTTFKILVNLEAPLKGHLRFLFHYVVICWFRLELK